MHYQLFNADNAEPLGTLNDVQGRVWEPGDRVTIRLDGKECMFRVTAVGPIKYEGNDLAAVARLKMLNEKSEPVPLGRPESGGI